MSESTFDFHGWVGFSLQTDDPRAEAFYQAEYGPAQGALIDSAPRVSLTWNSRAEHGNGHRASHKVLARWSYRLEENEREFRIRAAGNRWALPMVHHMLVHPALRLMASRSGTLLLHASAVARGDRSLILTGAGGVGKTTTSSLVLQNGSQEWRPHADDYVFVRDGRTYAYPTRSHLYRDLLRWIPEARARLTWRQRLGLQVYGRMRSWTRDGIKWPVRVPPATLWPGRPVVSEARLAAVVLLGRCDDTEPRLRRVENPESVVAELIAMNFGEAKTFLRLAERASLWAADGRTSWTERERDLLRHGLQAAAVYRLDLPRGIAPSTALGERLFGLLAPLVEAS